MGAAVNPSDWLAWEARFARFAGRSMADAAHDAEHLRRVVANAKSLAAAERADLGVVVPAAWLHDCVYVPKSSPESALASRLSAETAREFLQRAGYPAHHLPAITHAIEAHSFSAGITPLTAEARVVQDADRLDALGAIGIARCLMLGGAMGKPLYAAAEPLPSHRPPDDTRFVIDHFFTKLLRLPETMQTEPGRREAEHRVIFMRRYLEQLQREIGCES